MATVAGDHDAALVNPDPGVTTRSAVPVAVVTGESPELAGKRQTVSLGHPAGQTDVLAGTVGLPPSGGLTGQGVQALDAFRGNHGHDRARRRSDVTLLVSIGAGMGVGEGGIGTRRT